MAAEPAFDGLQQRGEGVVEIAAAAGTAAAGGATEVSPADLEVGENALAGEPSADDDPIKQRGRLLNWIRQHEALIDRTLYVLVTLAYWWYRSRASPTFTLAPFALRWNDAWGILFLAAFEYTRRPSYLVYLEGPARNLFVVGMQELMPALQEETTQAEFLRNIISSTFQLLCAVFVWWVVKPQPIPGGAAIEKWEPVQGVPVGKWIVRAITAKLLISAMVLVIIGAEIHTDGFTNWLSKNHGWKILLAITLGTKEEFVWRGVYSDDSNNLIQAFTWGVNHMVAGEGLSNLYLYGFICFVYALALSLTPKMSTRCLNHACIEYFVMNNLVK